MLRRYSFLVFLLVAQACGLSSKDDDGEECLSPGVDIPSICDGINDKFTSPSGGTLGAGGNLVDPGAGGSAVAGTGGSSAGGSSSGTGGSFGAGGAASASGGASAGGTSFGGEGGASW